MAAATAGLLALYFLGMPAARSVAGGNTTTTITATVSLVAYEVSASNIGYYSATISWKTNGNATSQVFYDTVSHDNITGYAYHTTEAPSLVSEHSIALTGLSSSMTYHYRVRSVIPDTEFIAISGDYTFTTLSPPVVEEPPPVVEEPPPPPPVPPAAFTVSHLSVSPGEVYIGERVTISVLVTNIGGEDGSYEVTLKLNGVVEATREVTVNPGLSKEVTFTTTRDIAGTYLVDVDGLTGSFTVKEKPAPAAFSVTNLSIQPTQVQPKGVVTITVLVSNTGGTEGSYTVVLNINDIKEAEKSVALGAGKSEEASFSVTRKEPGTYGVTVDTLSGQFTVVPLPINWPLIGGIIAAVVVVGLVVSFLVRRRRA